MCIAGSVAVSCLIYKKYMQPRSEMRCIHVKYSVVDLTQAPNILEQSNCSSIQTIVSQSEVEKCIESYCSLCQNTVNTITDYNWMEIEVDGVMVVQMRVESLNKDIITKSKDVVDFK